MNVIETTLSPAADKLLPELLALSPADRRVVVGLLDNSLVEDQSSAESADPVLYAELERRRLAYESGERPGIDGEQFLRKLREEFP